MLQLGVERCSSVSVQSVDMFYVLTIVSVKILQKCDETSLRVTCIVVSLTLKSEMALKGMKNFFTVR